MSGDPTTQRDAFLAGEGDNYFKRNLTARVASWVRALEGHLDDVRSIAEIGCADGRNLAHLCARSQATGWGVDPSHDAIASGRAQWPEVDLSVGSADDLPTTASFDLVICGFFLYLVDRHLLSRVIAESDRIVRDGGALAIYDFDPPSPRRRRYRHLDGLYSYKMAYYEPFLSLPHYSLIAKQPFDRDGRADLDSDPRERRSLVLLRKDLSGGYVEEPDD